MAIINSKDLKILKDPGIVELKDIAKRLRSYAITAITAAGSGHTGGVMSIMDIVTVLYFKVARHDPKVPEWDGRDRIFWSAGHKAPALYAVLGLTGYFELDKTVRLRKLGSGFEGHPNRFKLPGIELSSGSLGQGLGVAIGSALRAKLDSRKYKVYCIMGDGELDEGSVWEAAMSASHHELDNLVAVIDRNKLQIDGFTEKVMQIEPIKEKWISFGWEVFECDGHDMKSIIEAFSHSEDKNGKPKVIIAKTLKGKSISFAENICEYHGICPKDGLEGEESLNKALKDIDCNSISRDKIEKLLKDAEDYQQKMDKEVESKLPRFSKDYFWNSADDMKTDMEPTRMGFGKGIEKAGEDERVVALGADITGSIKMSSFYEGHPEREKRFFSMGIAEQNMTTVAAGLAKEGKIPFIGSYGVFITGRNWDQIRTTVCYNDFNVKIVDAHGGISVGPDGATHQALEDISNLYYIPNMKIVVPSDTVEARKATIAIKDIKGPCSIRLAREATPILTEENTPFVFGSANIIRYRAKKESFIEAFETCISDEYESEDEELSIIACGPMVAEAMRAAYILKEEEGIECRIINMHTVKPIDCQAILKALEETKNILTAEEHQVGGFGNIVAGIAASSQRQDGIYRFEMVGVKDRFGESGKPWELMKIFGLTAEYIAKKAKDMLKSQ